MLSIVKKSGISLLITSLLSAPFLFPSGSKVFADPTETNVALGQAAVTTNGVVTNAASLKLLVDGDRQTSNYEIYPGHYAISQMLSNIPATKFWKSVYETNSISVITQ
ncbi:MAG: hypothetical protein J7639_25515 [Paenibacillaceae bacterium]|nr:hypothetical protein [Paenibacillaceae bacterium]